MHIPSRKDYERVLRGGLLSWPQLRALQALYNFPDHSATAPQIAAVLGYEGFSGANSVIGGAGKRISNELAINPPRANNQYKKWFSIVANAEKRDFGYLWVMHSALVSALEKTNLIDPSLGIELFADETAGHSIHEEGTRFRIEVNIYERSREARNKCVAYYGSKCIICNFDFESVYGALGKGFIHVHHLVQLSEISKTYIVDPIRDLRPVCPNCHAMLHKGNKASSIEKIKKLLKNTKSN